jgi:hypothetical protein
MNLIVDNIWAETDLAGLGKITEEQGKNFVSTLMRALQLQPTS